MDHMKRLAVWISMTVHYFLIASLALLKICRAELTQLQYSDPAPPRRADGRRPFYIIGHMVNSVEEIDQFLRQGSNALEADIEFAENGTVVGTYHGMPCDCFRGCFKRTPISKFLDHLRNVTSMRDSRFRGQMSLLFLDLKTTKLSKSAKPVAGVTLAYHLVKHLWKDVHPRYRMNVLLSIGYVKDRDVTRGAISYLMKKGHGALLRNIGFDVGMNDPLKSIARMLKAAVKLRDSERGYIDKVYHWTIDLPFYIAKSVRLGVDGIITNQPHNVLGVVTSIFFQKRLKVATMKDSPWQRFRRSPQEVLEDEGNNDTNIVAGGVETPSE
ncbi:hypothetical protein MRX96_024446 [Rhipicephalus microplus]